MVIQNWVLNFTMESVAIKLKMQTISKQRSDFSR